jgi:hypothetical protein
MVLRFSFVQILLDDFFFRLTDFHFCYFFNYVFYVFFAILFLHYFLTKFRNRNTIVSVLTQKSPNPFDKSR